MTGVTGTVKSVKLRLDVQKAGNSAGAEVEYSSREGGKAPTLIVTWVQ